METALAIVEAMKTCSDWSEVEKATGVGNANATAHRCYTIHGLPDLKPDVVARWTGESFMRSSKLATGIPVAPLPERLVPDHSHGLGKRN